MARPAIGPGERGAIAPMKVEGTRDLYRAIVRYREPIDVDADSVSGDPRRFRIEARGRSNCERIAEDRWDDVRADWEHRRAEAALRFTLDGVAEQWFEHLRTRTSRRSGTIRTYQRTWRTCLSPVIGDWDVNGLTTLACLDVLEGLRRRKRGHLDQESGRWVAGEHLLDTDGNTIPLVGAQARQVLGLLLTYAIERGLRADGYHPLRNASQPERRPPEPRPVTNAEWADLRAWALAAATRHQRSTIDLHDFLVITRYAGTRIGETLGLTWDRVDLTTEPPTALINRQILETKQIGPTKTSDTRLIALHPDVVDVLTRRLAEATWIGDDVPVLAVPARTGAESWTWPQHGNMRTRLRALVKGTSLEGIHPHNLRHSMGTAAAARYGDEGAKDLLGHATTATLQHYVVRAGVRILDPRHLFDDAPER